MKQNLKLQVQTPLLAQVPVSKYHGRRRMKITDFQSNATNNRLTISKNL